MFGKGQSEVEFLRALVLEQQSQLKHLENLLANLADPAIHARLSGPKPRLDKPGEAHRLSIGQLKARMVDRPTETELESTTRQAKEAAEAERRFVDTRQP